MLNNQVSGNQCLTGWCRCQDGASLGAPNSVKDGDWRISRLSTSQTRRLQSERLRCQAKLDDSDATAFTTISTDALAAAKEARENLAWSSATVVENRAASADGAVRLLVLSVEDHVDYIEGRKLKRIQKAPRWIDAYTLPGQFIAVRFPADRNTSSDSSRWKLLAISSSPYDARRDSALLDASIIEVLTQRDEECGGEELGKLAPGDLIEVSQVVGRGFASLFSSYVGLLSALEDRRPLLLLCAGTRGISPIRAVLKWAPVQALATTRPISLLYVADAAVSAACLQEWDSWRDMGVTVVPLYLNQNDETDGQPKAAVAELLQTALFEGQNGLQTLVGGKVSECAVLLSGLSGKTATNITRLLAQKGVGSERLLFCDYF